MRSRLQHPSLRNRSKTVRVLAIDGGGIRGILPARALIELERLAGRPIAELFEIVAGTASGGILALGLTMPGAGDRPRHSAEDMMGLFASHGPELYPGGGGSWWSRALGSRGPRHRSEPLEQLLVDYLDNCPLGEAKRRVIIPTYDVAASRPLVLDSEEFAGQSEPLMHEVARATFAGPGYFSPARVSIGGDRRWLADGGLVASNPAMLAYVEALDLAEPKDVLLVSLGSGSAGRGGGRWPIPAKRLRARADTVAGLFGSLELSSSESHHRMVYGLLSSIGGLDRYWRIETSIHGCHADPDDASPSNIRCLRWLGEEMVSSPSNELARLAHALTA